MKIRCTNAQCGVEFDWYRCDTAYAICSACKSTVWLCGDELHALAYAQDVADEMRRERRQLRED